MSCRPVGAIEDARGENCKSIENLEEYNRWFYEVGFQISDRQTSIYNTNKEVR